MLKNLQILLQKAALLSFNLSNVVIYWTGGPRILSKWSVYSDTACYFWLNRVNYGFYLVRIKVTLYLYCLGKICSLSYYSFLSHFIHTNKMLCPHTWTQVIFVIDILQEEIYIYGTGWNKTPGWRDLFVQNTYLSSCFFQRLLCSWAVLLIGH